MVTHGKDCRQRETTEETGSVSIWEIFMDEGALAQKLTSQNSLVSMLISDLDKLGCKSLMPSNIWTKVDF